MLRRIRNDTSAWADLTFMFELLNEHGSIELLRLYCFMTVKSPNITAPALRTGKIGYRLCSQMGAVMAKTDTRIRHVLVVLEPSRKTEPDREKSQASGFPCACARSSNSPVPASRGDIVRVVGPSWIHETDFGTGSLMVAKRNCA